MGYTYKYIPIAINHSNMPRFRIRQSRACTNALQTFESVTLFTPVCAFSRTTFRLYLLSTSVQVILHFTLNASASFRLHNLYIYIQMIWLNLKTLPFIVGRTYRKDKKRLRRVRARRKSSRFSRISRVFENLIILYFPSN